MINTLQGKRRKRTKRESIFETLWPFGPMRTVEPEPMPVPVAIYEDDSAVDTRKPWEIEGIPQSTWYYRRKRDKGQG